jgi:hypothetical protein
MSPARSARWAQSGLIVALTACLALAQSSKESRNRNKETPAARSSSMTGCVDQQGAEYILAGLNAMKPKARLRGEAFSNENFARFVGHSVTVHGKIDRSGDVPVIGVVQIENLSDTCDSASR